VETARGSAYTLSTFHDHGSNGVIYALKRPKIMVAALLDTPWGIEGGSGKPPSLNRGGRVAVSNR